MSSIYDDIARTLDIARRPSRMVGITPGEDMAMKRVRAWLDQQASAPASVSTPPAPPPAAPLAADEGGDAPEEGDLIDVLGELGERLLEAGFENLTQVREASDETLLAVPGIGPARVRSIREATGG